MRAQGVIEALCIGNKSSLAVCPWDVAQSWEQLVFASQAWDWLAGGLVGRSTFTVMPDVPPSVPLVMVAVSMGPALYMLWKTPNAVVFVKAITHCSFCRSLTPSLNPSANPRCMSGEPGEVSTARQRCEKKAADSALFASGRPASDVCSAPSIM